MQVSFPKSIGTSNSELKIKQEIITCYQHRVSNFHIIVDEFRSVIVTFPIQFFIMKILKFTKILMRMPEI